MGKESKTLEGGDRTVREGVDHRLTAINEKKIIIWGVKEQVRGNFATARKPLCDSFTEELLLFHPDHKYQAQLVGLIL